MPLTDTAVRHAKNLGRNYSLKDMDGLYLFVSSTGAKSWHFRFTWLGKPARISLGMYPQLSLKDTRFARDNARTQVAKGIDPRAAQRQDRLAALAADENSFAAVFLAWRTFKAVTLKLGRQTSLSQIDRIFAKDVLPLLGPLPIAEISRQHLIELLRRIESRQAFTTAEKCRTWFNQLTNSGPTCHSRNCLAISWKPWGCGWPWTSSSRSLPARTKNWRTTKPTRTKARSLQAIRSRTRRNPARALATRRRKPTRAPPIVCRRTKKSTCRPTMRSFPAW
ncbi:integrase arm-type DNA-binding domain-containing protein [Pseudomonas frederiksbergensis]|nr:integrase arm-type DNA-binding domain-containing protein [Pseudomonas frederiksbergensis]